MSRTINTLRDMPFVQIRCAPCLDYEWSVGLYGGRTPSHNLYAVFELGWYRVSVLLATWRFSAHGRSLADKKTSLA